jgi:threonine dehydratase
LGQVNAPETVANGLKGSLKEMTWHFVSKHVTNILTATDEVIVDAMKLIWKRLRIVMEPSSAPPLATILKNIDVFAGKKSRVIMTGGNVDLDALLDENVRHGRDPDDCDQRAVCRL